MVNNKGLKQANTPNSLYLYRLLLFVGNRLLAMEAGKVEEWQLQPYLVATTTIQMMVGTTLTLVQRMG